MERTLLLHHVESMVESESPSASAKLKKVCDYLHDELESYDWVGFYVVNPNNQRELVLGPYAGAYTDHKRISFGRGVCGQVAETKQCKIVSDVSEENNYLSCSNYVKSEIVVPLFQGEQLIAEFDIDSHCVNAFSRQDEELLKELGKRLLPLLVEYRAEL